MGIARCHLHSLLLGGCTYESGTKAFATTNFDQKPDQTTTVQTESGAEWLKTALEKGKTDKEAQTYWYKGYVKTQSCLVPRRVCSMEPSSTGKATMWMHASRPSLIRTIELTTNATSRQMSSL